MTATGKMTFIRYGRSRQLEIATAQDLQRAAELEEAHWVATNAPIATIHSDATFLALLDSDHNGRITCHEVKDAIRWLFAMLTGPAGVATGSDTLALAAINADSAEGQQVLSAAGKMLERLGQSDVGEITLAQVRQTKADLDAMPVSEAGVVLPEAAKDADVRQFLTDVLATVGGAPHPSGRRGVGPAQLEAFLADAQALLTWRAQGEIPPGEAKTEIMPLGARTAEAYALLASLRGKIDQYFVQCEALSLEERFAQRMGWTEAELEGLDFDDPAVIEQVLTKAPLTKPRPGRELRFEDSINPRYAGTLSQFRRQVVEVVVGESSATLTAGQWREVKAVFAPHQQWLAGKAGQAVEMLGAEAIAGYLEERYAEVVQRLIAESDETAFVMDNVRLTEKLLLYQAHLLDLANNFVGFPHLYDPKRRAMFEMGTLVMDGRRFNLAVRVDDRGAHAAVAKTSNMYLMYVEVAGPGADDTVDVAVPVTSGGKGNLCVGKRGVFYDLDGRECDARVAGIIDNPISVREALVSPFRRVGRLITGKIESIAARAEKKLDTRAGQALKQIAPGEEKAAAPKQAPSGAAVGGMLAGAGLAVAALGSAAAYITKTLAETNPIAILIGVLAAVLVVMLPTSIIAMLKLRKRDLSAILEGSGWAINARMRLTRKLSRYFTQRPRYPRGSLFRRRFW